MESCSLRKSRDYSKLPRIDRHPYSVAVHLHEIIEATLLEGREVIRPLAGTANECEESLQSLVASEKLLEAAPQLRPDWRDLRKLESGDDSNSGHGCIGWPVTAFGCTRQIQSFVQRFPEIAKQRVVGQGVGIAV